MKKDGDELREYIFKKVMPIFNKVLKEKDRVTMSVPTTITFFWRPNNYRLLIPFSNKTFRPTPPQKPTFPMELKWSNFNSKVTTRINGITIMRDKNSITAIYSLKELGKKIWYKVECNTIKDVALRIDEKVSDIENRCVDAIKLFVKKYGGRAYFEDKAWIRHEDGLHGEDFVDKIPPDIIIHDTYFKKVYQDHIEFKSPIYLKNYISNRSVEELAPEIAKEIFNMNNNIMTNLEDYNKSLAEYNKNVLLEIKNKKLHLKVLSSMDKTLKLIRGEKLKRKKVLSEYQTRLFV